jgi:hypothetical protein
MESEHDPVEREWFRTRCVATFAAGWRQTATADWHDEREVLGFECWSACCRINLYDTAKKRDTTKKRKSWNEKKLALDDNLYSEQSRDVFTGDNR